MGRPSGNVRTAQKEITMAILHAYAGEGNGETGEMAYDTGAEVCGLASALKSFHKGGDVL
jgi:hypothetical protein